MPFVCIVISIFSASILSLVPGAVIELSTRVKPAVNIYARFVERFVETAVTFSGGRLSEAEERTVSVLTCQEAKIADAIKVTYLDNNGEQKDGELHGRWGASD